MADDYGTVRLDFGQTAADVSVAFDAGAQVVTRIVGVSIGGTSVRLKPDGSVELMDLALSREEQIAAMPPEQKACTEKTDDEVQAVMTANYRRGVQ